MTDLPNVATAGATVPAPIPLTAEQEARIVWLRNLSNTSAGKAFHEELVALIKKHVAKTNIERQFAVASQVVGTLLPLVDPKKKMTEAEANVLIRANIARGRQLTLEKIAKLSNL